jgi:hypothetical protein
LLRSRPLTPYAHNRATVLLANALVQTARLDEALELVVDIYFKMPDLTRSLPVDRLAHVIGKRTRPLAHSLSLPIFFDIYAKGGANAQDPRRRYAYEDFLAAHTLSRPSELARLASTLPRKYLVYFLRYVCVENVLDMSLTFSSSREVAEERAAICRLLIQIDPASRDLYEVEIASIVRQLTMQRRVREIEQSKIYVDMDGVRSSVTRSLRPVFDQYRELRALVSLELANVMRAAFHRAATITDSIIVILRWPSDEAFEVLKHLVSTTRDEFVSSNDHGLNWYLSTRIRHGVLAARLRSSLQSSGLVTAKDGATGTYRANEYWTQMHALSEESAARLNDAFGAFSSDVDATIDEIVNEWIQIKRTSSPQGMFDFDIVDEDVRAIERDLTDAATIEDFTERTLRLLNDRLDANLSMIRTRLDQGAKATFDELLAHLKATVEDIPRPEPSRLLNSITNARTEMQNTLRAVGEWFRRSTTLSSDPFTLEDAVNVTLEVVERLGRPLSASVAATRDAAILLRGERRNALIDLLLTLFGNISTHSGFSKPEVAVNISAMNGGETLVVRIENEVTPEVLESPAPARVETIRREIRERRYFDRVSREGGTGFFKVARILSHEFHSIDHLDFGFASSRFFTSFQVPVESQK